MALRCTRTSAPDERGVLVWQVELLGREPEEAGLGPRAYGVSLVRIELRETQQAQREKLLEPGVESIRDDQDGARLARHEERELGVGASPGGRDQPLRLRDLQGRVIRAGVEAKRRFWRERDDRPHDGAGEPGHRSRMAAICSASSMRAPGSGRSSICSALSAVSLSGWDSRAPSASTSS